jgi:predicted NBD/HSP70 family sugar kinase
MNVPLTKEFLLAVEAGAKALRDLAIAVERDVEADATLQGTSVERICQGAAEGHRQTADLLDGWAARYREPFGLPKRD